MTIIDTLNKSNDRLSFVRTLANDAASDLTKSEKFARIARQKLAMAIMTAIDNSLISDDVDDQEQRRRIFSRNSAVRAALKLYPNCEAPDNGDYPDMSEDEVKEWLRHIAVTVFPAPVWLPDSGFKKSEASDKQMHELNLLDRNRAAAKRAARFAFLLIARGVHVTDYDDARGFAAPREYFFPPAIKFKGAMITNYKVVNADAPVYMTPGRFGMVRVAAELDLGADGSHTYQINATVENFEKAASQVKARNEADELANALKFVADLKVDRKFTAHQRELVNRAINQLTAIKAAWDAAETVASQKSKAA